jgi:hypothetical protein
MLGSSRVAAQLAASQEGLSSMSDDDDDDFCVHFQSRYSRLKPLQSCSNLNTIMSSISQLEVHKLQYVDWM